MFGLAQRAKAADDYGGFIIGMQTYSLRNYPVDKALELCRELGVKSLEFATGHVAHKGIAGRDRRCEEKGPSSGAASAGPTE